MWLYQLWEPNAGQYDTQQAVTFNTTWISHMPSTFPRYNGPNMSPKFSEARSTWVSRTIQQTTGAQDREAGSALGSQCNRTCNSGDDKDRNPCLQGDEWRNKYMKRVRGSRAPAFVLDTSKGYSELVTKSVLLQHWRWHLTKKTECFPKSGVSNCVNTHRHH